MVSIKAAVMVITLLTVCLLTTKTSAAKSGCCESYYKGRLPFKAIKGYSVQTDREHCRIPAIIFHTKKARVCTDPALDWVINYVGRLGAEAQKVHRNAQQ